MPRAKSTDPTQVAEKVKACMHVMGGRNSTNAALLDISPAIADTLLITAEATAAAATEQREREAHCARVLTDNQVSLDKVKRQEALDFYGPSVANPCIDAYAAVERGKQLLRSQVKTFEAEFLAAMDTHDVRVELAEFATRIAENEEQILTLQQANEQAARALQSALTLTNSLKAITRTAGINKLTDRSGNYISPAESITRHQKLAEALGGAA